MMEAVTLCRSSAHTAQSEVDSLSCTSALNIRRLIRELAVSCTVYIMFHLVQLMKSNKKQNQNGKAHNVHVGAGVVELHGRARSWFNGDVTRCYLLVNLVYDVIFRK